MTEDLLLNLPPGSLGAGVPFYPSTEVSLAAARLIAQAEQIQAGIVAYPDDAVIGVPVGGGGASILPLDIDFSTLSDGALPSPLAGATWAVSGGKAVNTPTLGDDLFDPGAGTFESGTYSWIPAGANTIENDAGQLKITYVNGSTGAYTLFKESSDLSEDLVLGNWYQFVGEARVNAGSSTLLNAFDGTHNNFYTITVTSLTEYRIVFQALSTTNALLRMSQFGAGEVGWLDNLVLKMFAPSSLLMSLDVEIVGDVVLRATPTLAADGSVFALLANVDDVDNPTSYVMARLARNNQYPLQLVRVLNGTPTPLITSGVTYKDGALFELRRSGNLYQLWYDGSQIGTDQEVTDAAIINNTRHGVLSTGGNSLDHFFAGVSLRGSAVTAFLGGSITYSPTGYAYQVPDWIMSEYLDREVHHTHAGTNGQTPWSGLIRLQDDVIAYAPDVVFMDFAANAKDDGLNQKAAEAAIRRVRTALPGAQVIFMIFPRFDGWPASPDPTPTNAAVMTWLKSLAAHYDVTVVDVAAAFVSAVEAETYAMEDLYDTPDGVHPSVAGHTYATSLTTPLLTLVFIDGAQWSGDLDDYATVYDDGTYEADPIIRTGVDNDGETGTGWSTDGTARESSTANDTISWSGTFASFGIDAGYGATSGVYAWSVDGGAETEVDMTARTVNALPYELGCGQVSETAAEHTVTLRVVSGTVTINRFLAI